MLFRARSIEAIRAKLVTEPGCSVLAGHGGGVVYLFAHDHVVWGVDQTASAELSADATRIRCQRGPWVVLNPEEQRRARMAAAVAKTAAAAAKTAAAAQQTVAAAMVGTVIEMADRARYGCPPPVPSRWVVTHLKYGEPIAEPVGLTEEQRLAGDLLARRVRVGADGTCTVLDGTYCLAYERRLGLVK
jgi:hypothetical protein